MESTAQIKRAIARAEEANPVGTRTICGKGGGGLLALTIGCNVMIQNCLTVGYMARKVHFCALLTAVGWRFAVKRGRERMLPDRFFPFYPRWR